MKNKGKVTPKQAANLARGREKLFQKQLRQRGIPKTIVQREIMRQPVINQNTTHQHHHSTQIKLSLFNEFIGAKLFSIETKNNKKEILNLLEIINRINSRLDNQWKNISLNKNNIEEIINHINYKGKETEERFKKLEKRISELEKENGELGKSWGRENE